VPNSLTVLKTCEHNPVSNCTTQLSH